MKADTLKDLIGNSGFDEPTVTILTDQAERAKALEEALSALKSQDYAAISRALARVAELIGDDFDALLISLRGTDNLIPSGEISPFKEVEQEFENLTHP